MKKLLLLIMLLPFFAMAQTGELKPIGAKSLQTPNNATFHFNQPDSLPGINMGSYGYANLITKEYQRKYLVPYTTIAQIKEFSGFINNEAINVSYNHTNRTVTLSGDLRYQWQGRQYQLTSPWTSSAHTATAGSWFLSSSDGTTFTWSQTPWSYYNIHVCFVNYNASNLLTFATREVHGATMDWQTHFEFHNNIGTFKLASDGGGIATVGTYTLNTATDAATTPGFNSAIVYDEDIKQSINSLIEGTYTTMYVLNNTTSTFNTAATFPFLSSGSYMQINDVTTGTMSNGATLKYYNVYDILLPTASDGDSQKYRHIFLQPQNEYSALATAQLENTASLQYGSLSNIAPEFFVSARITYATSAANGNTGKCTIAAITYITGNKSNQVNIAGLTPTNHTLLTNLGWTSSGHTGTINTLAAFDGTGLATNILQSSFAPSSGSANYIQASPVSMQNARILLTGSTVNSSARFGSFEVQSYATNNAWFSDNTYYNGSNHVYRNNGFASQVYFDTDGSISFFTSASGVAGNAVSRIMGLMIASNGNVNIPFNIQATTAKFTTGAAANSLFQSDAVGLGSWVTRLSLDLNTFGSGAATSGSDLTANGSGGAAWVRDTLWTTIPISDETTSLTTGTVKRTFRMPVACTLLKVRASVTTAPTGSTLIFDINENGTTILSTKLSIDASEKTSKTAATQPVISDTTISNDSEMTIDIDQIGSTIAGSGAKITLFYFKN